jgi:Cytochrome b(C-terminal)/b6/petD
MQHFVNFVNSLFQPYTYFAFSVLGFWAMIRYREKWTEPKFALKIALGVAVAVGLSMMNDHFREISTKSDNVPIFLMVFSVGFFTWLSFRQAVVNDRRIAEGKPPVEKETSDKKVYVWPDLVYIEFLATIVAGVALLVWSLCLKAPLEQSATPAWTPNPSKAPWYFLGLQEMLVYYDPWLAGVVFPSLIIVGLMAIPYIDKNPKGSGYYTFNERKLAIIPFLFGFLIMWITLIFLGTFLRGPSWNFFGPFEAWDPHKVVVLNNVNLSEFFWVKWLGALKIYYMPQNPYLRELPGFAVVLAYFVALPPLLTKKIGYLRGLLEKLGIVRYGILINLMLLMAALPIKMILRWLFNLKYIISIPEIFFNI